MCKTEINRIIPQIIEKLETGIHTLCGYGDSEYRHQIIVGMGLCGEGGIRHDDSDRNRVTHGGRIHTGSGKLMDFVEGQISFGGNGIGINDDILVLLGTYNIHINIIKVRFTICSGVRTSRRS